MIRMHRSRIFCIVILALLLGGPVGLAAEEVVKLEAERFTSGQGKVYRDDDASGEKCALILLTRSGTLVGLKRDLPMGDYEVTAYLRAVPVEILHKFGVTLRAGGKSTTFGAIHFDSRPGYQPFKIRLFHPGGDLPVRLAAHGETGFDGMRREISDEEQKQFDKLAPSKANLKEPLTPGGGTLETVEDLEARLDDPHVNTLKEFDYHVRCDRLEIRRLRAAPSAVSKVVTEKVHYLPGETIRATAHVLGGKDGGTFQFIAEDITGVDRRRQVHTQELSLKPLEKAAVDFEFEAGEIEFGHELRCSLRRGGQVVHENGEFFGLSKNVYRVGITAKHGGHNKQKPFWTAERVSKMMDDNKRNYANYYEVFAWAPCDYSYLAPETELFWSGQTQYPGSVSGFKLLLDEGHKRGIKGITYGKSCGAGIYGYYTFQRHPELFRHGPARGPVAEALHTFYLERMIDRDYGEWQHWASLWTKFEYDPTVELGAQAIIESVEMFGWDGIRWDGHFVGNQKLFKDILNAKYPNFIHGYNIAFANPKGDIFLPRPQSVEDFHECARGHGLMMDESVRDWAHTNFSPGWTRKFYEALAREGDYIKRIGGLPLIIVFDMATQQDRTFNVLCALAAGERYTYLTSPGDFQFGPLPKYLTRYSAYVWDDTARVAEPERFVKVEAADKPKDTEPWWRWTTWLRGQTVGSEMPEGHQQLLVNILNPPRYKQFCNRVQTPPGTVRDMTVSVQVPEGARLVRAFHTSPDLIEGLVELERRNEGGRGVVKIPRLRTWSIVGFEFAPTDPSVPLRAPLFPLTTPVKDAEAYFAAQEERKERLAREAAEKEAKAGIAGTEEKKQPKLPYYSDYENQYNVDAEWSAKAKKPDDMNVRRDGLLDVQHCRGVYSWLNPVENAMGLLGGGNYTPCWVDRVGFKLRQWGCMDDFPDQYEDLLSLDVLVLDNIHSVDLGIKRRAMIADYVKNGGAVLYFGGWFNLSLGGEHNTALAELLPVRIVRYENIVRKDEGMSLTAADRDFFGDRVDWAKAGEAFVVDVSPLKDDVEVLAKVGDYPAIVRRRVGKGRILAVLINPHGDYPETATPYWKTAQWPRILGACLDWVSEGYGETYAQQQRERRLDPKKPDPEGLIVRAPDMTAPEFTQALKAAIDNMIDRSNARLVLQAAMQNHSKIGEEKVFDRIITVAEPYIDASFAEEAERLVRLQEGLTHAANEPMVRAAAIRILGITGQKEYRPLIEKALREKEEDIVRQALLALGKLRDPAAVPAVERYLQTGGDQKLLATAVLKRLGKKDVLETGLPLFVESIKERIHLKSKRRHVIDNLYGGVSFKLTKLQRRRLKRDLDELTELENKAKHDVAYFARSVHELSDAELGAVIAFLQQTEDDEITSLAYAIFARLEGDRARRYREGLKAAKLPQLRMIAEE